MGPGHDAEVGLLNVQRGYYSSVRLLFADFSVRCSSSHVWAANVTEHNSFVLFLILSPPFVFLHPFDIHHEVFPQFYSFAFGCKDLWMGYERTWGSRVCGFRFSTLFLKSLLLISFFLQIHRHEGMYGLAFFMNLIPVPYPGLISWFSFSHLRHLHSSKPLWVVPSTILLLDLPLPLVVSCCNLPVFWVYIVYKWADEVRRQKGYAWYVASLQLKTRTQLLLPQVCSASFRRRRRYVTALLPCRDFLGKHIMFRPAAYRVFCQSEARLCRQWMHSWVLGTCYIVVPVCSMWRCSDCDCQLHFPCGWHQLVWFWPAGGSQIHWYDPPSLLWFHTD